MKLPLLRHSVPVVTTLLVCLSLSGCIVAGYSSGGGWFIWPGSLGLIVIVVVALLLMRRR